ncbi:Protein rds1 [Neolecta irregularis DAH-3]|uniref:Protein rds1 n=1 Tax=Neolecta irregularis (strain DAH-3) TaxID=1198029 RepID=A0A1U7LHE9_NEOID|nr:Protein rds1 [Neolecta irregularis DAH-3]|eukprot:OLL22077.1 Protein rds1 [Neolecta irregularis DAH-3]
MHFLVHIITNLLAVSATPLIKRQAITDADVLQFALTLEHLEDSFYKGGIANFTAQSFTSAGFSSDFYTRLQEIGSHESSHVSFLTAGLTAAGATPVAACTYKFPYTDAKSFVTLSRILEGVGVSAYSGAAQFIANNAYLTAAATILTVESRHNAFISQSLGSDPFPVPFDTPLDPNQVYTLAAAFIVSCPSSNGPLPFSAFPTLTVTGTTSPGSSIGLNYTANSTATTVFAAFYNGLAPVVAPISNGNVTIPSSITAGQTYVVVTTSSNATAVSDANIVAGPAVFIVSNTTASPVAYCSGSTATKGNTSFTGDATKRSVGLIGAIAIMMALVL